MINVTVGSNTDRQKDIVDANTTLKTVLEKHGVKYDTATLHLDGASLKPGDINKTFAEMGITDSCYLIAVVKADNAA